MNKKFKFTIALIAVIVLSFASYFTYKYLQNSEQTSQRQSLSLQEAISTDNLNAVKLLTNNGADLERRFNQGLVEGVNDEGYTALGWALFTNRPQIALWLLEQGADANASMPMNNTMLYWAIVHENSPLAVALIDKGADIQPYVGYNPALHAKVVGLTEVVKKLAEKGVYPNDEHQS